MARINLLPWREERRKQREREFYMQLGVAAIAGVLAVVLWSFWMGGRIDGQNARNSYLKDEIHQLDQKIAQIKNLEKVRAQLLARKAIIEQLQANRSQMVHLFDEMVKTIPPSVQLYDLVQKNDALTLKGMAQSNASVAEYMRNLQASPWIASVDLDHTSSKGPNADPALPYEFMLNVKLTKPGQDEQAADAGKGKANGKRGRAGK